MAAIQFVIAILFCFQDLVWPSLRLLPWTIGVVVFALTSNYSLTRAFFLIMLPRPPTFTYLPYTTLFRLGFVFYDENPDAWVLLGGSIVILGSWLNLKSSICA